MTRVIRGHGLARHCAQSSGTRVGPSQFKFLLHHLFLFLFFLLPDQWLHWSFFRKQHPLLLGNDFSLQPFGLKVLFLVICEVQLRLPLFCAVLFFFFSIKYPDSLYLSQLELSSFTCDHLQINPNSTVLSWCKRKE